MCALVDLPSTKMSEVEYKELKRRLKDQDVREINEIETSERLIVAMNRWNGWTDGRMGKMDGRTDGVMDGWTDGWDGWVDGRMGWMDGRTVGWERWTGGRMR